MRTPTIHPALRPLRAALALAALIALTGSAAAQTPAIHHFRCDAPLDGLALKTAAENLRALDGKALLSADHDRLKVRIDAAVPHELVLRALNAGPRLFRSDGTAAMGQGFPVRIDTGDPAADDQRHAAAKAAWMQAHPEEYQRMIGAPTAPRNP